MPEPKMPPLPSPDTHCWDEDTQRDVWSHSADQTLAYALQVIDECVKVCDEQAMELLRRYKAGESDVSLPEVDVAVSCREAIRGRFTDR